MGSENEPAKLLLPYLQRADELQKHEPLVAYYCRLYAMERGMKIPSKERTKTTNALLVSLMNQLEKDKKFLKLVPEDSLYVEGFALNVFAKADKQDRASRADVNTAKTFYAASIFFEILNQFGELQPDLEQKQKYAAWKAVDIRKALKEGRRPEPGPPGGDKDLSLPASTPSNAYDLGSSETIPDNHPGLGADASPQLHDDDDHQLPTNTLASHPFPTTDYRSIDFNAPPSVNRPENSSFHQPYHHQPYTHETLPSVPQNYSSQETQPPVPQNYPSHETQPPMPQNYPSHDNQPPMPQNYPLHETSSPSYSYPNFQSYPSFNDSNLPTLPSHYPSQYQGLDASYTHQSTPVTNYPSSAQYTPFSSNGTHSEPTPTSAPTFQYDSNYEPPPDKIAEAHKAARFAVGALAFDDVPVAVDFLIKSLELLTKPSASQ